jgi:hypothetical protein
VPRPLTRRGAPGALGNVEGNGNGSAVELVGELGATEGKPTDNDAAELEGKLVGVEAVE